MKQNERKQFEENMKDRSDRKVRDKKLQENTHIQKMEDEKEENNFIDEDDNSRSMILVFLNGEKERLEHTRDVE